MSYKPLLKPIESYERTDYKELANEFGCHFRIGKRGIKFFANSLPGIRRNFIQIIPLDGWYTDPKAVEHIQRERGYEL